MKCPVPCYMCSDLIELDAAIFNTAYCECRDSCTHGVCSDCFDELLGPEEYAKDQEPTP